MFRRSVTITPAGYRMLMSDEREADQTDPGQGRDVGQGYPEEQPGGAGGGGAGDRGEREPDAPDPAPDRDSGPETATGNPGAAG
jgi:hypothetical protein